MGTHFDGTAKERRSLSTFIRMMRGIESFNIRTFNISPANRLSYSQFATMEALFHLGPMFQKDIAAKLLRTSGNLTMVINNLEKQGLARRHRLQTDRRFTTVHLTRKGTKLMEEIFPKHAEIITREMSVLSDEEQETLGYLCKKLGLGE
jgi:MarR family 2-MHQ and catechol resistance regulon transcriptional repressor